MKKLAGLLLALAAAPALAHVYATKEIPRNSRVPVHVGVPHGCHGSDTLSITILAPYAGSYLQALPHKTASTSSVEREVPPEKRADLGAKEAASITFTGDWPDLSKQHFGITLTPPPSLTQFPLIVEQRCKDGMRQMYRLAPDETGGPEDLRAPVIYVR